MMVGYYGGHMGALGWTWMVFMAVVFCAVIAGAVALIVWAVRGSGAPLSRQTSHPQQLLAARYARGEIDEQEYRERLRVLREQGF